MAVMTAAALKKRLAELLEISNKDADDILWAIQEICTKTVEKGEGLIFPGVGKLECNVRPARTARNPRTGESVKVPAKVAVKFKIATALKKSAPELKSKHGKALLEEAETKQAERVTRRKKREREEAKVKKVKKLKKKRAASRL